MGRICWSDTETYCETPIQCGTYKYAEDAEVMLWAYAFDEGPVQVWDVEATGEMPRDLAEALDDPFTVFVFHNSAFDTTVLRCALNIDIPATRLQDTMVQALAHALPGALGTLCEVMGVAEEDAKDKKGRELLMFFCKPRPVNSVLRRATRLTHPKEWAEFVSYAGSDIKAMRAIHKKMPKWNINEEEMELWRLDRKINARGFAVDVDLAEKAITAVAQAQKRLSNDLVARTGGSPASATQRDKMLKFILETHGVDLPDLQKATIERRLNDEKLPVEVKELLALRLESSMASTSKYAALMRAVSSDGRLRGTLQFCGASRTGRWCLAEGTRVLVRNNNCIQEKAIETVTQADEVWDGDAWVRHEGVVFSGEKEVIEHDGVIATAEHIVYSAEDSSMPLGEAKIKGIALWQGNKELSSIV